MYIKLTRRSTIGYGINTTPTEDGTGAYYEAPTYPTWKGTFHTVQKQLRESGLYQTLTYLEYSSAWFVCYKRKWYRVEARQDLVLHCLWLHDVGEDGKYINSYDLVEVEGVQ